MEKEEKPKSLILSSVITLVCIWVYSIVPGLHYLLLYYLCAILFFNSLWVSFSFKKHKMNRLIFFIILASGILILAPIIIDGNINKFTSDIGFYLSIFCFVIQIILYLYLRRFNTNFA